jgi:hypothetical protein
MIDLSSRPGATVGLRHVLEDGVALLDRQHLENRRQGFVIQDLTNLLEQAAKGGKLTEGSGLFASAGDASAFEAYSLVFRYLRDAYAEALATRLGEAYATFRKLSLRQPLQDPERAMARHFLDQMLVRLNGDEAYSDRVSPAWPSYTEAL